MTADFLYIFWWWLVLFGLGVAFLPFTSHLFSNFIDRGYPFAKVVGILLLSYTFFLASHAKLISLTLPSLLFLLAILVIPSLAILGKWHGLKLSTFNLPRRLAGFQLSTFNWRLLFFEELLFFFSLTFWSFIRGFAPEIRGLEKFMDFGFVNSILTNKTLPPLDMWLTQAPDFTGHFINYYYFGHLYSAVLTKLSGLDSAITYNLLIATLFAFSIAMPFSIGINLLKNWLPSLKTLIIAGLITSFLVALAGNLHTIYVFTTGYPNENPVPFWQILDGYNPTKYWYPNATRFIKKTIHEFPIYSFVVSDLHGHVLDIPFVLLTLALLLSFTTKSKSKKADVKTQMSNVKSKSQKSNLTRRFRDLRFRFEIYNFSFAILLGLVLAVMYMTNAWDGIIYLILAGLVILVSNLKTTTLSGHSEKVQSSLPADATRQVLQAGKFKVQSDNPKFKSINLKLKTAILNFTFLIFNFFLFTLPFTINFKPFVSGIGVVCPPQFLSNKTLGPFLFEEAATHCDRSPLWMLGILWGFFVYTSLGFLGFIIFPRLKAILFKKDIIHESMRLGAGINANTESRLAQVYSRLTRVIQELKATNVFILLTIIISTLLLTFPEFFYAKDIYPAHYRANTMFKLGYQAFIMMQIASAYIFFRILFSGRTNQPSNQPVHQQKNSKVKNNLSIGYSINRLLRLLWLIGFFFGFYLVGIYPYFAINSYYGGLKLYKGLDGVSWMKNQYPDDYKAILWLREQIAKGKLESRIPEPEQVRFRASKKQEARSKNKERSSKISNRQPIVILEAVGESYTDYARISAYTGLPTVVGWPVHEWLWRGSYDEAGKRIPLVETMYTSSDISQVKNLLDKYNVSYVFVGALEKQKYPKLIEDVFWNLGKVVFESGETRIYKMQYFSVP